MKYPRIINEIACNTWAMRQESFSAMLSIVNGNGDGDDIISQLFHVSKDEELKAFIGEIGERQDGQDLVRVKGNVAILDIDGPIVHRASGVSKVSGLTSIEGLGREFQELESRDDIDTILLLMDTPGGVVAGTSEFASMVAKSNKKTIAYVYGAAASAGYWIASAADKIISSDVGVVGSIGVIMTAYVGKDDDTVKIISSQSPNKQASLETKEGKKDAQQVVDDMADVFISAVAENRATSKEDVLKNYGKGKIFVAAQALERGMIDEISTLAEVLDRYTGNARIDQTIIRGANSEDIQTKGLVKAQKNTDVDTSGTGKANEGIKGERMTLKELMDQHPEIKGEVDAVAQNAVSNYQAMVTEATKFIGGEYEGPVSALAVEVIQGKAHLDSLRATVTAVDQMREDKKAASAKDESSNIGDIGSLNAAEQASPDGLIRNDTDIEAEAKRLKAVALLA